MLSDLFEGKGIVLSLSFSFLFFKRKIQSILFQKNTIKRNQTNKKLLTLSFKITVKCDDYINPWYNWGIRKESHSYIRKIWA